MQRPSLPRLHVYTLDISGHACCPDLDASESRGLGTSLGFLCNVSGQNVLALVAFENESSADEKF